MATRRERLERKLEKRNEWAQKATFCAAASFGAARRLSAQIPFGQPILVGHHSERRARKDAERITRGFAKGCELSKLASHHSGAATGLERQLEGSIFSDDPDAVEALEAKIEKAEAYQDKCKRINAAIRKHAKAGREAQQTALEDLGFTPAQAVDALTPDFAGRLGVPDYVSKNNGANIRRLRKRLEEVKARQARTARAEEAPDGVLIEGTGDYVRVTFPDKPAREVLDALRAAGFRWGAGSWVGRRAALPAELGGAAPAAAVG